MPALLPGLLLALVVALNARLLHGWSQRAAAPFVIVSAASMTPDRPVKKIVKGGAGSALMLDGGWTAE